MTTASITAVVGLVVVMTSVLAILGFPHLQHTKALPLSQLLDVLKLVLGTVAGVGALFALVMAYRRQRLAEVADDRDQQRALLDAQRAVLEQERALLEQRQAQEERTRVFNERFGAASAQLGHDEPAVRLAGAYAMAGLADDWEQGRQTCIDVLCAFLRLPYTPDPGEDPAEGQDPVAHAVARAAYLAAREVRHTVIRIIGNHLNGHTDVSWHGHDLDFTGAVFDGGDFRQAVFTNDATISFQGARFVGGTVDFGFARFEGGRVDFRSAEFVGGRVGFGYARFESGTVDFGSARFKGGTVDFRAARFKGGTVDFRYARFESGTVGFGFAHFKGGGIDFGSAEFVGGTVDFSYARFESGRVDFRSAEFVGGTVDFGYARFVGGTVSFRAAQFKSGGTVDFRSAEFWGGRVDFESAEFMGGRVDFSSAEFEGGTVDFDSASGQRPAGLPYGTASHLS
ncbi:pentapeptide repeat-containing protein [Actinomadura nitritigenes]|uniref:pentapeptide repeat-containing protein n=1 Tax=Actinomadura nitritigenes TaxID=134602 RepID=UPI003D93F0CB